MHSDFIISRKFTIWLWESFKALMFSTFNISTFDGSLKSWQRAFWFPEKVNKKDQFSHLFITKCFTNSARKRGLGNIISQLKIFSSEHLINYASDATLKLIQIKIIADISIWTIEINKQINSTQH